MGVLCGIIWRFIRSQKNIAKRENTLYIKLNGVDVNGKRSLAESARNNKSANQHSTKLPTYIFVAHDFVSTIFFSRWNE